MTDPIRVIESAYATGAAMENEWLEQLAASIAANVPSFAGTTLAYTYDVRDDGWVAIRSFVEDGPTPLSKVFMPVQFDDDVQADIGKGHLEAGIASMVTSLQHHMGGGLRPFYDQLLVANGFEDLLIVRAIDPTRSGCAIVLPTKELSVPHRSVADQWRRLSSHVAAGLRLRQALAAGRAATDGVEPEAILSPNGRLEHAVGPATSAPAREGLALAARSIDRARGPLRRRDPSEAVEIWRGLVAGRWSLVDRFDSDGRRFLVAHRNDPRARDPRGLTERERQVLGYAELGRSNKLIAYELGLSPSTVGVILKNARVKLKRVTGGT